MKTDELVSIIIPTFNSSNTISHCLKSIVKQRYNPIEIIVVDNFSTDNTREIAEDFNTTIIEIKTERAKARNIGIQHAKGTYVFSLDSDMELEIDVIKECVNKIESIKNAGGVIIPEISVGPSFWVKVRNFERSFYNETKIESARFFKKQIIDDIGGYEEDIVFFEESTLPQKIERNGFRIDLRITSHIIHHEENFNFFKWLNKKYYYAQKIGPYLEKYDKYATSQISPLYRLRIFLNKNNIKRFIRHPILAFGVFELKFFEYAISAMGYLSSKKSDELNEQN